MVCCSRRGEVIRYSLDESLAGVSENLSAHVEGLAPCFMPERIWVPAESSSTVVVVSAFRRFCSYGSGHPVADPQFGDDVLGTLGIVPQLGAQSLDECTDESWVA